MTGLLDQEALDRAFTRLAELLGRRRAVGHVYIVGGAAMIMAYHAERATRDVDALILEGHGPVMDSAAEVARELSLPGSWLNEQASVYIPRRPDHAGRTVFDHPNLKVTAGSPRLVMAMKTRAARPRDIADLRILANLLDLDDIDGVIAVHDEVFPSDPLPARTEARLRTYWE